MPFICLANANVPDGVLQITDLWPNVSQHNNPTYPPGQNRYLNRPAGDTLAVAGGTVALASAINNRYIAEGLAAYLADVVDPGGSEAATGTVTLAGVTVAGPDAITFTGPLGVLTQVYTAVENTGANTVLLHDPVAGAAALTIGGAPGIPITCYTDNSVGVGVTPNAVINTDAVTIAGVLFTAAAIADVPNQIFTSAGGNQAVSDSLVLCINHANAQALLTAALDALVMVPTLGTLTATNAAGAAVPITLTPSVDGTWGDAVIIQTVGGATLTPVSLTHTAPDPTATPPEFGSAGYFEGMHATDVSISVATSLVAAIESVNTQIALAGNYAGPAPAALFGTVNAGNGAGALAVVTLTASLPGFSGRWPLATAQAAQVVLGGGALVAALANPALFQFDTLINSTLGTNVTSADSLVAALNNAASDVALGTTIGGSAVTATNVAGTSNVVTVTADTAGSAGAMGITDNAAGRIVESAAAMAKTMITWTAALLNAGAVAVQAEVDAGRLLTAAGFNTAINAVAGITGISIATGNSTLADVLSILAGRRYQMTVPVAKDAVTGKNWSTVATGAFTTPNTVFDSQMYGGEWGADTSLSGLTLPDGTPVPDRTLKRGRVKDSATVGGEVVNNEIGMARATLDGTHFQASVLAGQCFRYANGITLFPDPEVQAWSSRTAGSPAALARQATLVNQRVVTVYDDDGTLLV